MRSRCSCWMWPRSAIRTCYHQSEFTLSSLWVSFVKRSRSFGLWRRRRRRYRRCVDYCLRRRLLAKRQHSYDKTRGHGSLLGRLRTHLWATHQWSNGNCGIIYARFHYKVNISIQLLCILFKKSSSQEKITSSVRAIFPNFPNSKRLTLSSTTHKRLDAQKWGFECPT